MPKLIMMSGPSGSGKSWKARELMTADSNAVRINRDCLRAMSILKWTPRREGWIIDAEMALCDAAAKTKRNIIIDDTNLMPTDTNRWIGKAMDISYEFQKVELKTSLANCIKQDQLRRGKERVGRVVIERQFLRSGLVEWPADKQIVIFDIDGTVAELKHRLPWITIGADCPTCDGKGMVVEAGDNFDSLVDVPCTDCKEGKITKKNYDRFYSDVVDDEPIEIVIKWAQECAKHFCILIVSGRSPENLCANNTLDWLYEHGVPFDHIYMRRNGIHGPDYEEKQLILNDILKTLPKERIEFVVDDRPSVIKMWRSNGLKVYPVRGRDDDPFYSFDVEDKEKPIGAIHEKDIPSIDVAACAGPSFTSPGNTT